MNSMKPTKPKTMREIKFRGKCLISGKLVYGDLIHGVGYKAGKVYILPNKENLAYVKYCDPLDGVCVDAETIGQFTGLQDQTGKDVYEGDFDSDGNIVIWCNECCGWQFGQIDIPTNEIVINCHNCDGNFMFQDLIKEFEIIGNRFENKELLTIK